MSDPLYRKLFSASPAASLLITVSNRKIEDANEAACSLLQETPTRLIGKPVDELFTDPAALRKMMEDMRDTPRAPCICELRDAHGLRKAVELQAVPLPGTAPARSLLTIAEADAGRQAEPDPRCANDEALELAALVYRHSDEAMMVTDARTRIIAINPAFTRMTGYTEADALGHTPALLRSGRQTPAFYQEMWNTLNTTGTWRGQLINRRKNGEAYVERLTISTIRDQENKPQRYVALFSDISEKLRYDNAIWTQANVDALTGLPNRRLLRKRLEQQMRQAQDAQRRVALLSMDLDGFKEVNDTLGHHIGDQVLIETAKRLRACVRVSDTVARTGGDEFVIMLTELAELCDLPEKNDLSIIEKMGKKIVEAIGEPFLIDAERIYLTPSIGIATGPDDADSADALLATADQAMHAAKQSGRNRFQFFTRALHQQAVKRIKLIADLRVAIDSGQFELAFQPIVNLQTGALVKAEALLRWRHPLHGIVSPADFIPVAESSGLIVLIGDWVFRQAAQWRLRWQALAPQGFQLSVNVSPAQFRLDEDLPGRWIRHCEALGLPPRSLVIEITEGLLLEAGKQSKEGLRAFHDAGMQIALDDFGTGYSGLSYLRTFEIDYIKIDQAFVRDMHSNPSDLMLSEAIVAMAHKLGIQVVAEGIEEPAHRELLARAGCDYGQGYLFSRPVPPERFETLLRDGYVACEPETAQLSA